MAPNLDVRVAVAGEALIDLISDAQGMFTPCLGGAVYNLSRALSRQGIVTTYLNPLSGDRFGQSLASQLQADHVHIAHEAPVQAPTSLAVVNLNHAGHPDYAFYREGVADRQLNSDTLHECCNAYPQLEVVCTGALALDPRDANIYVPWLEKQKAQGRSVVVDANLRPSVMPDLPAYRQMVMTGLRVADIIKVSDEDLQHLQVSGSNPLEQAKKLLHQTSASLLALTLGADGAWLLTPSGQSVFAREATPLRVADTVGAGDSFLAGLLTWLLMQSKQAGLTQTLQALDVSRLEQALQHALASASLCVQQQGCVPPTLDHIQDWIQRHPCVHA